MPEPWISANQVLKRLANLMRKDVSELDDSFLEDAQQAAYIACDELRSILLDKGWTEAKVEAWDSRVFYATQLGAFHAAVSAIGLADYNMEAINALDCREWVAKYAAITVAGSVVAPVADATIGGATFGSVTAADTSRSSGFDPLGLFRHGHR